METNNNQLLKYCRNVLDENRRGDYTIPSGKIYPHQWLWDSCFTAIGLRHYDVARAQRELESLLRGQWDNGMLPNMIFAPDFRYCLERTFWNSSGAVNATKSIATSCITQPPMLAEAVVSVGQKLSQHDRQLWYRKMLPPLISHHKWLYAEREPNNRGLAVQIHPYESGMDNTPTWISELLKYHHPWWRPIYKYLPLDFLINLLRRDIKPGNKLTRINNFDSLLYIDILWRFRRRQYDIKKILSHDRFLVEDLAFNCILIKANRHLVAIAKEINRALPEELLAGMKRTETALDELWDNQTQSYYPRSFKQNKLIKETTIAGLLPLYSGAISQKRAKLLVGKLLDPQNFGANYPVPSVALNSKWFREKRYWQGPTWINSNWLIIQGLRDYGFDLEADNLTKTSLELVAQHGSNEYFSPITGAPVGAKNFSWTAALTIDLLESE